MNREEVKQLLKIMATAYPRHFADMTKEQKVDQIDLYLAMFGRYQPEIVVAALHNYIADNEYPPSIAGLKKQIDLLMPEKQTAAELWNILARACSRGSTLTQEEFDELPAPIRAWCGNIAQIREMARMDAAAFNSVTRGQFLKTVPLIIDRQTAIESLPKNVKMMLQCQKQIGGANEQQK